MSPLWLVVIYGIIAAQYAVWFVIIGLYKRVGKLEREQLRLYRAISRILAGELPRKVEP